MSVNLLVAALTCTVLLPAAEPSLNCRYSLSPVAAQHTAEGGLFRLRVTASHPQCPWTFTPASWVHVSASAVSPGSGTHGSGTHGAATHGSRDLTYELLPNFFEQPRVAKLRLETKSPDGSPVSVATLVVRQQGRGQ